MRSLTPPPYLSAPRSALNPRRLLLALLCAAAVLTIPAAGIARAAAVVVMRGGGDGHGIGMSQYGAYGYALHGADYRTILAHYYQGTAIGTTDPDQTVRVLLGTGSAAFSGATGASGASGKRAKLSAGQTYTVTVAPSGGLTLHPSAGKPIKGLTAPLTVSGSQPLQLAGHGAYRGELVFSPAGTGVQTVNSLGLDDYVRGVVAAEMPSSWAPAALEAQAVAARTYAITTTVQGDGYDLYPDTRSQMYGGVGSETPSTDDAVAATAGQIVTYGGHPAVTFFFSSSGGHTESIQNVWPGSAADPWLQGVSDPYDGVAGNPNHSFVRQMTLQAAARRLGRLVRGGLVGVQVLRHGVSGRIIQAVVRGTHGNVTVTGSQLAAAFGLNSTLVSFTTITASPSATGVVGTVFPSDSTVALQQQTGRTWRTIATSKTRPGGSYQFTVALTGRFRVSVGTVAGPLVTPAPLTAALTSLARQATGRRAQRRLH